MVNICFIYRFGQTENNTSLTAFLLKEIGSGCVLMLFSSRSPCSANTGSPPCHFGTVHWAHSRLPGSARAKLINASCRGQGTPPADRPQEDPTHLSSAKLAWGTHSYTLTLCGHIWVNSNRFKVAQTGHCLLILLKSFREWETNIYSNTKICLSVCWL